MYVKTTWTTSTAITAELLNHLETQYDEFKAILDAHNHDDRYYLKSQADARYFWSGHMGYGSGCDADLLDGLHLAQILGASLPVGAIMIWKGSAGTVPSGWRICDGSGGTPDLRDRFIQGGGLAQIGTTGGSATITNMGGTVETQGTTLTTSQIPAHYHQYTDAYGTERSDNGPDAYGITISYTDDQRTTGATGNNEAHHHGSIAVTFSSFQNLPPFYALYYIQKVS